jgi:hypothetical protein
LVEELEGTALEHRVFLLVGDHRLAAVEHDEVVVEHRARCP